MRAPFVTTIEIQFDPIRITSSWGLKIFVLRHTSHGLNPLSVPRLTSPTVSLGGYERTSNFHPLVPRVFILPEALLIGIKYSRCLLIYGIVSSYLVSVDFVTFRGYIVGIKVYFIIQDCLSYLISTAFVPFRGYFIENIKTQPYRRSIFIFPIYTFITPFNFDL